MKLNRTLAAIVPSVIAASLAIWLAVEHQARLKRLREHQTLEQQLRQLAGLAARNEQLSNRLAQLSAPEPLPPDQLIELLRLRGEVSVLGRQQRDFDLDHVRKENRQAHVVLDRYRATLTETNAKATADYWPRGTWANAGHGSPEAALQTMVWAGNNGDVTNFLASVSDETRKEMEAGYKGKSETEISLQLVDEIYYLQSVQILDRETPDANTVLLTVEISDEQHGFQTVKMLMKKTGGEWKFAGPQ